MFVTRSSDHAAAAFSGREDKKAQRIQKRIPKGTHMPPVIPPNARDIQPRAEGLELRSQGKVRDTYLLPDHPDKMLVVATNRISIFDFVLNDQIHQKGEVLNALSYFWTRTVLDGICETDLVACGSKIDEYLPKNLRKSTDLQTRGTIVRILPAPDVEDIVRFVLTGSGWKSYQETGMVCGHQLPKGLTDGSVLEFPIYTPTTKAQVGHDEHITSKSVEERYGKRREEAVLLAATAMVSFAAKRRITMADTKMEFSVANDGTLVLCDEKGTPDSSRFWDMSDYAKAWASGKIPPSLDKQYVRDWGKKVGIDSMRNPENPHDVSIVHSQELPDDVARITAKLYRYIFWRLTGQKLEKFQREEMGINVPDECLNVEVLIGSESDLSQVSENLSALKNCNYAVSVMSCHRNPKELEQHAAEKLVTADVVIAGAGMAAALPGIVKSHLCQLGRSDIPVIGVACKGKAEKDDRAAILSIECLPGQPVELDPDGNAYFGPDGFAKAFASAAADEFRPRTMEAKPVKIGIRKNY